MIYLTTGLTQVTRPRVCWLASDEFHAIFSELAVERIAERNGNGVAGWMTTTLFHVAASRKDVVSLLLGVLHQVNRSYKAEIFPSMLYRRETL